MATPITLTDGASDRATAYHQASKIVRAGDELYVTWLDGDYRNILARLDPQTGAVKEALPVGQGFDNHCGAALTRTPDGTLHVVNGSHAVSFVYRSSATPMDPASWSLPQAVGAGATYPSFVYDASGALHLMHRYTPRHASEHWGVCWYRREPGRPWQSGGLLARMPAPLYSYPTNAVTVAPDGRTLHLVIEWYKTWPDNLYPPHTMAVSHLESPDGRTWFHTDGREVKLRPVGLEDTSPVLFDAGANLRPGNVAVLPDGRPCFAMWDRARLRLLLAVRDAGRAWRLSDLTGALAGFAPGLGFNQVPQVAADSRGRIVVVCGFARDGEWADPSGEIHAAWFNADTAALLRHEAIEKTDPAEPDWLPSLEKGAPGEFPDAPWLLFTTGRRGEGCVNNARCKVKLVRLA